MRNEKATIGSNHQKAKPENRTAFRLRFMSCERCLLCCGIGREGTLFPPFLLFLFLQFLLGLHFLQNLFQRLDRFRFLTLEPLEIDVLYKLRKRGFPRFLLVVVYLSELVRVQSQLTGHLHLFVGKAVTFLRHHPFLQYRFCYCHNHSFLQRYESCHYDNDMTV